MKSLLKWAVVAVVIACVLVIAGDPARWLARMGVSALSGADSQASTHEPRAVLKGSNQPAAPRESPESEKLDVTSLQAAADYAESQHSRSLIVTRHGYIVFEKYWQGSNFDTVVDSKGLGRVVAALATGVAIQERKIGWPDQPLSYFIPQWAQDPRGKITVRNLLQMSSGLKSAVSPRTALPIKSYFDFKLVSTPGQNRDALGADADILGYVLQTATRQPYAQYASQAIWSRIGAADASLWLDGVGGDAHADEGFLARQSDWLRVAELLLQNGNYQGDEVLVPRWVPEMLKPSAGDQNYGFYVRLGAHQAPNMSPYVTDDVFVVEGRGNRLWLVPSMQIAILRTGNPPAADWDEGRIPNLIVRGAHDFVPPAARPGADLRQLVPNH